MSDKIDCYKITVRLMIALYCRHNHSTGKNNGIAVCSECMELKNYSEMKLDSCIFGEGKPACSKCTIHCYKPLMREKIKTVMKYSGPRMLFKHPVISARYLYQKLK
ncbi:MAG: nitrous oxide-stimulated promoter family protein [Actinobacteria bacterium]|nr:nitrous oxide-stimulated promoter family protein [Actinomycetota bacterium]